MKLGTKISLILILNLILATPTSSVTLTEQLKAKVLEPKAYAEYKSKTYKWGKEQQKCLRALWGKESAWNFKAKSPTKDYGIPQRHMSKNTLKEIKDFLQHPHPQIDWGLNYIHVRYGSPCQAWKFHLKNNWY